MPSPLADLLGPIGKSCQTCRHRAMLDAQPVCCHPDLLVAGKYAYNDAGDTVKVTCQLRIPSEHFLCSNWTPRRGDNK